MLLLHPQEVTRLAVSVPGSIVTLDDHSYVKKLNP